MTENAAGNSPFGKVLLWLVLLFVCWYVYKYAGGLWQTGLTFQPRELFFCLLCSVAGHLSNFTVWRRLAESFGIRAGFFATGKAWFVSRMGRHVPGKIALFLVRMDLYGRESKSAVFTATLTEYIASVAAAWFLVALSLFLSPVEVPQALRAAAIGISICLTVSLTPWFLPRLTALVLKGLGKQAPDQSPSFFLVLRFIGAYFAPALFHGLAFFFLIRSIYPLDFFYSLFCAGIYNAASLAGLAAFFAPSGIGVREGVLFLTLPLILPKPLVVAAAIGIRLVNMLTEACLAGLFWLLDWKAGQGRALRGEASSGKGR